MCYRTGKQYQHLVFVFLSPFCKHFYTGLSQRGIIIRYKERNSRPKAISGKEVDTMYDYENNNSMNMSSEYQPQPQQPQYNFTTDPNQGYYQPPRPPKKKRTSTGLIVGIIVAAVAAGSLSGFGGSYLASRLSDDRPAITQDGGSEGNPPSQSEDDKPENTTPTTTEYTKPEVEVNSDLTSLDNIIDINTTNEYTYKELFEKVNESIVIVKNYVNNSSSGEGYTLYGTGSGVIFTTDGYVITNAHVVQGCAKVSIVVSDGYSDEEEIEAILVGSDSATDLAVLKVSREQAFTAAALGDSDGLSIGQEVCAIGNPAGLNKTLTNGIVSGLNRYSSEGGYELSSIQTNAAINPGNSGGGLFDMYGNVVGIVNSKLVSTSSSTTLENLGFAITINEAKPVISDLINFGYVTGRPTLGITTLAVNEYTAQLYGLSATGLLVTDIRQDAPVAQSGLRIGDVITAVNGTSVSSVADVQAITKGMSAGDTITVTVSRTNSNSMNPFGSSNSTKLDIESILTESAG